MKNIVVYESKYGSTEKYAKWISEELNCKISRLSDMDIKELVNYDNIIFGGYINSGKLQGFNIIYDNIDKLRDKNILVFAVGMANREDESYKNFKYEYFKALNIIKDFYLRGAFDFKSFTFMDKMKMRIFKVILKLKNENHKYDDLISMISSKAKAYDFTNREYINPIIHEVKSLIEY